MNTTETYPTIEAAVADLQSRIGMIILGDLRRELKECITENGLSKHFVAGLADEFEKNSHNHLYERYVAPGGIISISGIFYQVPENLEYRKIWVNPNLGEYYLTDPRPPRQETDFLPLQTLRLGTPASE